MDIKKKINKIIRRVAKSAKDIKNVSRKELSSAFQTAIHNLPNSDVKEAIETQFEKYLGDFERRVLQSKENGMFYHKLKPHEIWKPPKEMSSEDAEKIRSCMIAKKLKKGLDIKRDVSMLQSYQKDPRVLMKLSSSLIPLQSLKNVMDIYEGYCQNEMEKCLHSKDVQSIQHLADFTEDGLQWFSMKYRTIPRKMEKSLLTYADIMAALSSIYVDLKIVLSRDMEKKEITSAARMLCGFVSAVVPDSHKLDVLIQLAELTPDDQKVIWPYVKKSLKDFKISDDNKRFLKYNICIVKLSKIWPEDMKEFIQSAKKIPAPSDFITWISSCNPALLESIPTDRKFTGTHVTRFMLEDLDENLIEQFLEALTDRKDEPTETAESEPVVADDTEAVEEEVPDLELIEETEASTTSAPLELFFIDKGKPKAEKDNFIDLDEEEEENDEKMECDDDSGLNSESPLVLSDSDEEDDPTIIVDDALEEIEEVLQNAMNKEVSESEEEAEGEEDEDVIVMDDLKTDSALKKEKSPKKGKQSSFGDFEMHLSSLSKQLRSKTEAMDTDELNETVTEDTESKQGLVTPQKTPLRSPRSSSKRTTSTSSQKSNEENKRMGEDKKEEEIRVNNKSLKPASSSKEEKVQEILNEEADKISSDNDAAAESVVSDSCDSDGADFVSCPKIEENIKSASSKARNETVCEFMSPTVEMVQSKVRKSSRRKLLKDDNPAAEGVDVYTFIMSPAKKLKASEEDSSNMEDETAQTVRRRLRRKTTSDLLPESKTKTTKKDSTRKSLMSLENSNQKSDSKITEYFKTTPIRTHGKVLCRNESVEEKSSQLSNVQEISTNGDKEAEESESGSSRNGGTRRSTRKHKPAHVLSDLTKHTQSSPVKRTRSQSGSEGKEPESTTRQSKDSRIVKKSGVPTLANVEEISPRRTRSNSESQSAGLDSAQENMTMKDNAGDAINASDTDSSCNDMKKTGTSKLTPKKSPKAQKRVLRSRKATPLKETQLSGSSPVDSPRKSLRSRKI